VAGKGVPAALFMAVTQTLIKSRAGDNTSTASVLTHVNNELSRSNTESMFVTVFIGILDITSGEVTYTNAGHNPPYLRRQTGELVRLGERHGPVLGAVEGLTYSEARITMDCEDLLLLYTDGVTEAFSPDGQLFSEERLRDVLNAGPKGSAKSTVDDTVAAIRVFEDGAEQSDDITVLAVRFYGADSTPGAISQTIKIEIENDLSNIAVALEQFREFADDNDVSQKLSQKVKTALDELLNNIVSYAFEEGTRHVILIRLALADGNLKVTVSDDGVSFNPLVQDTPQIDEPIDERQLGGLGIHLVRNLADDVDYHRYSDLNVLAMVFHLDGDSET
jgi:sigma-B regulation protein RsbU (phosphoserine phosphatase)